ncbi:hypothetical protein ACHAW5_010213 [Stephanodiscus triporus]|uniref:Amine oxidase n=1 Tax=Stephanodiscus triporus TaxID=2934178 RepID=A0ABD3PNT8_9STRA
MGNNDDDDGERGTTSARVEVRWDVGAAWPNPWESRIILTGVSVLDVREGEAGGFVLLGQRDVLDGGDDVVGALAPQLSPRFWDVYHVGMTPSAEAAQALPNHAFTTAIKTMGPNKERFVPTSPVEDEEVARLRKRLYDEAVERDGRTPKLDPYTGRPMFFFWMNDAKACFTRDGGLGMAVYEWRAGWSESNEVGIELEP